MLTIPHSSISFAALLDLLALKELQYSVLNIWGVSKEDSRINIKELEEKTKATRGYILSFSELKELANQLDQVIECTIVAVKTKDLLPNRDCPLTGLIKDCDLVIEAVDSTVWEINANDSSHLEKVKKHLNTESNNFD